MLENVPTVRSAQEILDSAFLKANKIEIPDPERYHRIRKTEEAQMRAVVEEVAGALQMYLKPFPSIDHLPDYEREVIDILVGVDRLRKSLSRISWAQQTVRDIYAEVAADMRRERSTLDIQAQKRRCSGRVASVLYQVDKDLRVLREARDKLRILPTVHPEYATVVIAGFPNVGKSSLLAAWTSAKPQVAAYSFTTKQANVGHFEVRKGPDATTLVQVVDTPGLLDRPDAERNPVERQAVAALRHAADAVLFLLDPSETSGYPMPDQLHLLEQVKREMAGIPLVEAETKADLHRSDSPRPKFSTVTGEGLKELQEAIVASLHVEEPEMEQDPLELWRAQREAMSADRVE